MNSSPLISIIMPAFNRATFIGSAIKSLLKEDKVNIEIIVVDDGSTDETCEVVETLQSQHPNIRLIKASHGGVTKARNIALQSVSKDTSYIGFLDSDDLNYPSRILRQSSLLQNNPDIDYVIGLFKIFEKANEETCEVIEGTRTMTVIGIAVTNMLFRASVFQRMGLFDETLDSSEDVDYVLRLREAGIKYMLEDEPAILHRRHETNMTNDFQKIQGSFIHALRKSIVRRRDEGFTKEFDGLFKAPMKDIKK